MGIVLWPLDFLPKSTEYTLCTTTKNENVKKFAFFSRKRRKTRVILLFWLKKRRNVEESLN